jgi:uncharacterized membrane protein YfcA
VSWKGAALGLAAGIIAGLFGVGGGVIFVPGLILLLGFVHKEAAATSLVAVVITAAAGAIRFGFEGSVELGKAAVLFAGAAIGAYSGKRITDRVSNATLTWVFIGLMITAATRLLLLGTTATHAVVAGALEIPTLLAVGLFAGVVSASLGIGGGMIFVPSLVGLLGLSQTAGQGTSLATIVPTAALGVWLHAQEGRVQWMVALPLGLGGIVGAFVGAEIALGLSETTLRRTFALFLVLMAIRLAARALRARTTA